jgi:PAS domain S-box-containing protein
MDDGSSGLIDVWYVDLRPSVGSAVEPGFESDRITVSTAADADRALAALGDGSVDCLVVVSRGDDDGSLALVEAAAGTAPEVPRLVVTGGTPGLAGAALDAGATDCVVADGEDRETLLPHRIRSAVETAQVARETRDAAARFESLTQNTSFAVLTIDEDSTVQYASEAVADLFGYTPEELVGGPLTAIMPDRFHDPHHAAVADYLTTGERSLDWDWIELPGQHRDGTEIPLGVSFGERAAPDGHRFTAVIRDISEQPRWRSRWTGSRCWTRTAGTSRSTRPTPTSTATTPTTSSANTGRGCTTRTRPNSSTRRSCPSSTVTASGAGKHGGGGPTVRRSHRNCR